MVIRDDFFINNVSARSIGISTVDPLSPPPMASRRYTDYSVGNDTVMVVDDDEFDNILYTMTVRVIGKPESIDNSVLYRFLQGAKKLRLSRLPLYEFRIQKIGGIEPQVRNKNNETVYTITLELEPWKYIAFEPTITVSSSDTLIGGSGTRYSKPLYKLILGRQIAGSTFTVNGQQFIIDIPLDVTITDGILYLDAENDIVYDKAGNNCMMYTTGDIQYMNTDQNSISWTGDITSVSIKRNGRCY